MSKTAKKCEGAKLRGEVNLFPARERAWARGTTPLMLLRQFAVAGHCYSATAIRGQRARDRLRDFVEHLEGEILTLS